MSDESNDGVTCAGCGTRTGSVDPPLEWSTHVTPRGQRWLCSSCTRDNIRSIEGKLDEPWW